MIIPDDMVSRWHDQAKQRQAEEDAADKVQAKKDFRDICFTILASIAVSALGIAYVSDASQADNPSRLASTK
ncbi:MAG: hypothetical protein CL472_00800 [Acidobacteria bacterium]|mgnify:CR=1 FL=1|nr:hypothetical protein [Acidobacteriota bacterium]